MKKVHATPLIREGADLRPHHTLIEGQANTAIFGGWGVRFAGKI